MFLFAVKLFLQPHEESDDVGKLLTILCFKTGLVTHQVVKETNNCWYRKWHIYNNNMFKVKNNIIIIIQYRML